MESFQIIQPSALLSPYVKQYWFLRVDDAAQSSQRALPAGCAALAFFRGQPVYSSLQNEIQPRSYLSVQASMYSDAVYSGNLDMILLVFQPLGAKAFFRMPLNKLNGQNIALDMLDDPELVELEKRIFDSADNATCVYWIERFLLNRIGFVDDYNFKRLSAVINAVNCGEDKITALAQTACLGYKQFKRIFEEHTALHPKDFLRIARCRKTLHSLRTNPQISLSQLADESGYYDKSHLIKEIKIFSGYTPREYLANCDPYTDHLSLFHSFFINNAIVSRL